MDWLGIIKWLFSGKNLLIVVIVIMPGWGALLISGYVFAQVSGLQGEVALLRKDAIEERLEKTYTALCMIPGDQDLLVRLRDLQREYQAISGDRYPQPTCDLLMKLLR